MIIIAPEMTKVPAGATRADRERLFTEYRGALQKANPHLFHPDGRRKSTLQLILGLFRS